MLLQSLRPDLLTFQLVIEQTNLCLCLLPRPFRLGDLLLLPLARPVLFSTQCLEIATKDLSVLADTLQLRFEHRYGLRNVRLLHRHPVFFFFRPLQFVGLVQQRMFEFFDLDEVNVELLASIFVRFLRRRVFAAKFMGALETCEYRAGTKARQLTSET